jgi:hypothetical protein
MMLSTCAVEPMMSPVLRASHALHYVDHWTRLLVEGVY